jgi:hypothetical protein
METNTMTQTEPYFTPGDRVFSHYTMTWGTVKAVNVTVRDAVHGVTGDPLPDTTWYEVEMDNGRGELLDDAHGDWNMARIVPPRIAKRYGYGDDPAK